MSEYDLPRAAYRDVAEKASSDVEISDARIMSQLGHMSERLDSLTKTAYVLKDKLGPILIPDLKSEDNMVGSSVPSPPALSSQVSNTIDEFNLHIRRIETILIDVTDKVQL